MAAPIASLAVDGGASRNDPLLQILADMTDRKVIRSSLPEASGLGAGLMAWQALDPGFGDMTPKPSTIFNPAIAPATRSALRAHWRDAVRWARIR